MFLSLLTKPVIILVVCKKYYIDMIVNELMNASQPSTYNVSDSNSKQLIRKHLLDMHKWNICVPSVMKELPTLYWLPKLHKSPYGTRFIAASNESTKVQTLGANCRAYIVQ